MNKEVVESMELGVEIVSKVEGKMGYDPEGGKYRVLGSVTVKQIHVRKGVGSNIAPSIGYHVEEISTGNKLMVTKQQGVVLALQYGMQNAYVRPQNKIIKDDNGTEVKKVVSIYLQPSTQKESFTRDGRIVPAFKLNSAGKIKRPYEMNIAEEQCTPELWEEIQVHYAKGIKQRKSEQEEKEHTLQVLSQIKKTFDSGGNTLNPFTAVRGTNTTD